MKNTKILTVLGVLLAMGITACGGKTGGNTASSGSQGSQSSQGSDGTSSQHVHTAAENAEWQKNDTKHWKDCQDNDGGKVGEANHEWVADSTKENVLPGCATEGKNYFVCSVCGQTKEEKVNALGHDFGEGAELVDILEEEGSIEESFYKCKKCDATSLRWSALDYDKTKTAERSTKNPESRGSGKAIRFDSTANYKDGDTSKKGCHIVYNIYIPEPAEHLSIYMKTGRRTDSTLPPVINMVEGDDAKGYEYVNGELVRPATRYGIKIDGEVVIVPEDTSGQEWKDGINWYYLPGDYSFETAGVHEIEFYNLGGYRADFYEFALVGFGPQEHVAKYTLTDAKTNAAGKVVKLGVDKVTGKKAAMVDLNQISGAYASSKTSGEGEPEAFALGDQDANFKAANTYKLDKGKVIAFEVDLTAAVTGAKIEVGAEFDNAERYFYNMAVAGIETMAEQYADKTTEDGWRYYVKVNDGDFQPMGCELKMQDVLDTKAGKYMPLGTFDLKEGANMIYIRQGNIGYRVTMDNPLRVVFEGDATIAGEHAHIYNKFVSETTATCEAGGSKVMQCFGCTEKETVETAPLGHDFQEGTAANDVTPLTCSRCQRQGLQFNGFADNATGNNAAANDNGKLNKNATVTWTLSMPAAGTVKVLINAAYSAGNGNKAFASGWAIKGGASADALENGTLTLDTTARADSKLKQVSTYTYLEIGTVTVAAAGSYVISVTTYGSSAQARLMIDGLVRVVYAAQLLLNSNYNSRRVAPGFVLSETFKNG